MTTRTFKQLGQAYGNAPATITATINDTIIFSGEIPTIDTPLPVLPDLSVMGAELFTWTNTVEFSGTQSFSITTENFPLLLTDTIADYCIPNNVSQFESFYSYTDVDIGNVYDPFSNVAINGVAVQTTNTPELTGQWYWLIPAGSTFTATLNVNPGVEPIPPAP